MSGRGPSAWFAAAAALGAVVLSSAPGCSTSAPSAASHAADSGAPDGSTVDTGAVGQPDGGGIPGTHVDPGRSVSQAITASQGGTMSLPDGATLTIPPGALPHDMTITVTVPTPQSASGPAYTYIVEPPGVVLATPGTLTVPVDPLPDANAFVFAYDSSAVNPVVSEGDEQSNWVELTETSRDDTAKTLTFAVNDFTVYYLMIAVGEGSYLVTDIPGPYLHPGDLLFTLTTYGSNGPNWRPGHVAGFVGTLGDPTASPERLVEADGSAVVSSTITSMATQVGHIYLGAARPHTPLTSGQGITAASFMVQQIGKKYALIGEQSIVGAPEDGTGFSCVGLTEAAMQVAGAGELNVLRRFSIPTPIEQFLRSDPVADIDVCPGDDVKIPVYGVVVDHRSVAKCTTFAGYYSTLEPYQITATSPPPGSTFLPAAGKGYAFEWIPTQSQAGTTFTLPLQMTATRAGCPAGTTTDTVNRTLTIRVAKATPSDPSYPTVASVSASSGVAGDAITITGNHLAPAKAVVRFNGAVTAVDQSSSSDTQLVVRVPGAASTGPLTVATNCAILTAAPTFTVTPPTPYYTSYVVSQVLTLTQQGTLCGPYLASGQPYDVYALFGSDGSFWFQGPNQGSKGTGSPDGTFSIAEDSGGLTEYYADKIGADGALSTAMKVVVDSNNAAHAQTCWGDTERYKAVWAPKRLLWPAMINVNYVDRCPMNAGATDYLVTMEKDATPPNTLTIAMPTLYTSLAGILTPGGVMHETHPTGSSGADVTLDGTIAGNGTGAGTLTETYPDGCTESGAFTVVPLSPVNLAVP